MFKILLRKLKPLFCTEDFLPLAVSIKLLGGHYFLSADGTMLVNFLLKFNVYKFGSEKRGPKFL